MDLVIRNKEKDSDGLRNRGLRRQEAAVEWGNGGL